MKKICLIALVCIQNIVAQPCVLEPVWGLSARQGDRPSMEDTHTHEIKFKGNANQSFFAVYDGHGGKEAADIAAKTLHTYINPASTNIKKELENAFLATDDDIIKNTGSGSCAAVAYIKNNDLYIAWAGDSRIVLARNGIIQYATEDHKPDKPEEKKRIEDAGGYVTHNQGDAPRVNGRLAVARALGDRYLKQEPGVLIANPDIYHTKIKKGDMLIIACDGIWDVLTNQQAVAIVQNALKQSSVELEGKYPSKPLLRSGCSDPYIEEAGNAQCMLAARALRDTAYHNETLCSGDNLSVEVIIFK
ncbi:MAG TPA: PP2C family protein-serine/threonine phosphatase [Candidatus Babeliales bacterium]|nr:PP2C family protein-serine/threonine phosphatase [Candidatus Babeliales bacterium]